MKEIKSPLENSQKMTIMSRFVPLALAFILLIVFTPGYNRRREQIEMNEAKSER